MESRSHPLVLQDVPGAHQAPCRAHAHRVELVSQDVAAGCEGASWPSCWEGPGPRALCVDSRVRPGGRAAGTSGDEEVEGTALQAEWTPGAKAPVTSPLGGIPNMGGQVARGARGPGPARGRLERRRLFLA